ncbi:MAG TPA: serine/threonine-protein kinase, partial [Prosthecobacter sp.]|nr:serine/threonine-protein kinase [Prosthecobacter sp.]
DLQKALPQYEVSAFIARGGMGAVYRGLQRNLSRTVAIKVLPPEVPDNDLSFADRFMNEARAMARLAHPNIVAVYEAGKTAEGLLYFVMEFVEGRDVAQLIATERRLEPGRALEIAAATCDALTFAHEEGIIHRDIKPSNIMVDKRGRVKVADFGLAKVMHPDATLLTFSDMAIGTPDFVAPELTVPGMKVDERVDIYALGVTLYQMLTGQLPRGRFQPASQIAPQAGPRVDKVVDKALQSSPDARYASAAEMKRDLERLMRSRIGAQAAADRAHGRPPLLKVAVAAIALAAAAAAAAFMYRAPVESSSTPAPPAVAAPSVPVTPKRSPRNSPGGKAEAVWQSRWHKPGRIKAAGTDMGGRPFDLSAAEPFADFVQVILLDRATSAANTWVGLRSNGKVVWSDGVMDAGRIGLVRSWTEVQPILYGGLVEPPSMAPAPGPVTDFSFGRMSFLPGKPSVVAYSDLAGAWYLASPVFDAGLMEKIDLATPPKVTKVVVDSAGIGVLRKGGGLRIWNRGEVKLPDTLAKDVLQVLPMGNSWAVLKKDGSILNFTLMRQTPAGAEVFAEPPNVRQFLDSEGTAVDLACGGYSPLVRHADGHWSAAPAHRIVNGVLAQLHKENNQSFSVFQSMDKEGILWIEPVE